jgi:hypothetical protein
MDTDLMAAKGEERLVDDVLRPGCLQAVAAFQIEQWMHAYRPGLEQYCK